MMLQSLFPSGAVDSLSTARAVGIAVITTAVAVFMTGFLTGALVFYCINKHRFTKPQSPSHQQQLTVSSASNALQQTDPEYAEVIKLRHNAAYGFTQTDIETRAD